ncbi:hypothetical protein [Beijerinckia sp. L45]|uniref:hypothetical protein n=1 Tax=Beijerinckia sp. L45 TaxID=1641855 RepID=UPI00131C9595|nr:hypothetical protein [Beijerinckia sp. L45]
MMAWRVSKAAPPPQVAGETFWAWLSHNGILLMRWKTAQEVALQLGCDVSECEGRHVTIARDEEHAPEFWLPLNALPWPPGVSVWTFLNTPPPHTGTREQGKRARR